MPTMVDFPTVVQDALAVLGAVGDTEPARRHCAAYLTGRIVAENQTVRGINRACALTTDPSCLPRWLTEGPWEGKTRHAQRLAWRHQAPQTRDSVRGVMALDHPLVTPEGQRSEDGGWCGDHADQRHVIAQDDLLANDVCPSGAHYPREWRRCQKRTAWEAGAFKDQTAWCLAWLDEALKRAMPGDLTCASSCPSATILHHLQRKPRAYGGDVTLNRQVV